MSSRPLLTHVVLNTGSVTSSLRPSDAVLRALANLTALSSELPGLRSLRWEATGPLLWSVYSGELPVTTCAAVASPHLAPPTWSALEAAYLQASDTQVGAMMGGAYCECPTELPWMATVVWPTGVRFVETMSWITQYNQHRAWLMIDAQKSRTVEG